MIVMFVSLIVFYFIFTFDFYFAIIILWSIKTLKARTERSDFKLRRSGTKISHIFLVCNVLIDNTDNLRAYILYDQVKKNQIGIYIFKKFSLMFHMVYGGGKHCRKNVHIFSVMPDTFLSQKSILLLKL